MDVGAVRERFALPGLATAVVSRSTTECELAGFAEVSTGREWTPDTPLPIASLTKVLTALTTLTFVEDGTIGLDDLVDQHLRTVLVLSPGRQPSVRELLTHTAGIGELRRLSDLRKPELGTAVAATERTPTLHEHVGGSLRLDVEPGTKWAYANYGYWLLGQLLADVTGRPFADVVTERVLGPLGMTATTFDWERPPTGAVVRYAGKPGKRAVAKAIKMIDVPAGGAWSTMRDLTILVGSLLASGAPVLRPETFELMRHPHLRPHPHAPGMGLGLMLERLGDVDTIGHDGGITGMSLGLLAAPDRGVGVVVATNAALMDLHGLAVELLREHLPQPRTGDRDGAPGVVPATRRGGYRPRPGFNTNFRTWMFFGGELRVGERSIRSRLPFGPAGKPIALRAAGDERVYRFTVAGTDFTLAFGDDGEVVIAGGMGMYLTLHRTTRRRRTAARA